MISTMMKQVQVVFLLIVVSAFLSPAEPDNTFSVMTYNILRPAWAKPAVPAWSNRVEGIAQIIRDRQPGIVGLQEEDDEMVSALLKRLPSYDYTFPVQSMGAGILYRTDRWTPLEIRRKLTVDGRWITEALMERFDGQQVYGYCLHLSPFEEWKRMMGAELLRQMVDARRFKQVPVLVMGDMNTTETGAPIQRLTEGSKWRKPLLDAFKACHSEAAPDGFTAYCYGTDTSALLQRIDYIFFSEGLRPLRADVVHDRPDGFYPSDHLPVCVEFIR